MFEAQVVADLDLFFTGRCRAIKHQVGAEELGGTQQHRAIKTGTEVADGRAGRHGDQQGEEQHPQLAGAGIAQ